MFGRTLFVLFLFFSHQERRSVVAYAGTKKKEGGEKKTRHSAASAEQAGFRFKSSGRGRRVTESAGERRRCIRETETSAN